MILLDATTKKVEVVLGGAITTNQLDVTTHYADINQTTFAASAATEADTVTNSTTPVTIIASPGAGITRQIKFISVYNNDTVVAVVKIRFNNNGTLRIMVEADLNPGDTLQYVS